MTRQQLTLIISLQLLAVVSVGAFLISDRLDTSLALPEANTLPATPMMPTFPPQVSEEVDASIYMIDEYAELNAEVYLKEAVPIVNPI